MGAPTESNSTSVRDNTLVEIIGTDGVPIKNTSEGALYTHDRSKLSNSFTPISYIKRAVVASQATSFITDTASSNLVINNMRVGGREVCDGSIGTYVSGTTTQLPGGGFNSTANVALWTDTSIGDSLLSSWAYTTARAYEGTGSVAKTFTKSDANNYPEITYNYSTPQNFNAWRYISAQVRVTVAAGGAKTRTVQLRVTSGTAVRIWQVTGTTTTAPFSTEQWLIIQGELENPTATAGTGTFDINNVTSVSLRLTDSGNKTGTIYWDDVRFTGAITIKEKLYSLGATVGADFLPPIYFASGDTILFILKNNGSTSAELQINASGVGVT